MLDDDLRDLPGLAAFGDRLVAAATRPPAQRRRRWHGLSIGILAGVVVTASSAAGTAAVLKSTLIRAPERQAPKEQTPVTGTARTSEVRAADPAGGPPWALRISRSETGLTCSTVGQTEGDTFGIVGTDRIFRAIPEGVVDACGTAGSLFGVRIVASGGGAPKRSVVYGLVGDDLRRVQMTIRGATRDVPVGAGGSFVEAIVGTPADNGLVVVMTMADGSRRRRPIGLSPHIVPDSAGGPAWALVALMLGRHHPLRCAQLYGLAEDRIGPRTPSACLRVADGRPWVADATTFRPGDKGVPGFDRWTWREHPARTVVWGVGRRRGVVRAVTLLGDGAPRRLQVSPDGVFGAVLHPDLDPAGLRLVVRLADGTVTRGRPGQGLVPDVVPSRRRG